MSSCVTPYQNPNLPTLIPESIYFSLTDKNTVNRKMYDGFNQTFEINATFLKTDLSRAQLDQRARIYQWNVDQYSKSKSELETSLSKETKIFFDFFVPERHQDDLNKIKTSWRIFLDAGGKRYEGKAEKFKTILADIQSLYPTHNRFFTPYMLTFPVPVSIIENGPSKLTITGPVGSTSIDFQ
jgi:hypothetical protein